VWIGALTNGLPTDQVEKNTLRGTKKTSCPETEKRRIMKKGHRGKIHHTTATRKKDCNMVLRPRETEALLQTGAKKKSCAKKREGLWRNRGGKRGGGRGEE